ncbi:MAG: chordopoxvirus fusion protein, partial [Thermodesulfovibrio sp.]
MLFSIEIIEELEKLEPAIRSSLIKILKSLDKTIGEMVKREDFLELKVDFKKLTKIVEELAEAQKRTEQRVEELAEAQKRTEERLARLENIVAELAEAQKRTEQRVEELAE